MIATLLLVDDDQRFRERLAEALRARGLAVTTAADPEEARERLAGVAFEGIVTDLRMPGAVGLQFVKELCEASPQSRVVVLTGYGTIATAVEAMRLGAKHYLMKPCNADQLLAAFEVGEPALSEAEIAPQIPSLARLEREHIERVLVECDGNVSKAARVLGIHRRTLQYKLAKFPSER